MNFRTLFAIALLVFGSFSFVGCGGGNEATVVTPEAYEMTPEEKAQNEKMEAMREAGDSQE